MKNILNNKILILAPDFYPAKGGVENFLYEISSDLIKNFKIDVYSGSRLNSKFKKKIYKHKKINIYKNRTFKFFGIDLPTNILSYYELYKLIKSSDVVIFNDIKFLFFASFFFTLFLKKKKIFISHGFFFHNTRYLLIKKAIFKIYLYLINKEFDSIISNGDNDTRIFKKNNINSIEINLGVNSDRFKIKRNPIRGNFLYFGRIDTNKGLEELILFLKDFRKLDNKFKLEILGSGSLGYVEELRKKIKKFKLENHVIFKGNYTNKMLINRLTKSEIVFNPSKFESFGLTLLEALAAGTQVICSNIKQYNSFYVKNGFYKVNFKKSKNVINLIEKLRSNYSRTNFIAIKLAKKYSILETKKKFNSIIKNTLKKNEN